MFWAVKAFDFIKLKIIINIKPTKITVVLILTVQGHTLNDQLL